MLCKMCGRNCSDDLDQEQPPCHFLSARALLLTCEVKPKPVWEKWKKKKKKSPAKVHDATLPPPPTPPSRARLMSPTTSDDGALSFRVERALKVRVGLRPTSLILAGLCHLVLEDK